ncbi:hypothetical protein PTTG_26626 [Puccinia triticina 1-1 BBBD Race 1]|uniref:Uncharacterized protein n=1 Tax=Puccinia triticina (isolate 1-1 / race 1 (BBBD)) TaxID=630390 RepID=A0A180GU33_PUCT1|nr:hypothetical protein PTTG_26626 [Puccinia triticina 1-1 BBBD Race 1]
MVGRGGKLKEIKEKAIRETEEIQKKRREEEERQRQETIKRIEQERKELYTAHFPPHQSSSTQVQMANAPSAKDFFHLKSEIDRLERIISANPAPRHVQQPALVDNGNNREINRTLKYVFECAGTFTSLKVNFARRPWKIFTLLKDQCDHSDQQHKLAIIQQLTELVSDNSPGTDSTLAKWSKVWAEITQLILTLEEVGGLLLQNSFTAPVGVDLKTFEFKVSQKLENANKTTVSDVMTVIQAALGKSQGKSAAVFEDLYVPMDLETIQAMRSAPACYAPPHR